MSLINQITKGEERCLVERETNSSGKTQKLIRMGVLAYHCSLNDGACYLTGGDEFHFTMSLPCPIFGPDCAKEKKK